jgi:PAS domain S-box-containing protein
LNVAAKDFPTLEPASILLVDDRPENLFALKAMLTSRDNHLVTASSGEEALALLLLREDFALIVLDVWMPTMDGFAVAYRIKQSERTRHIPIIFVTAVATDASQVAKGYSVGAVDYLIKPLDVAIVRAKVGVFVDLYRQRQKAKLDVAALSEARRQDDQRRLEELRVASDKRYRRLVEGIDRIIGWSAEAGTLRLSFVSRRAQRLFGCTPMDFVAPDFWARHIHPDDRASVLGMFREAVLEETDKECVHRFLAGDGRELWLRTSVSVEPAIDGGAAEIHGVSMDITDMKRAEDERNVLAKRLDEARQRLLELANDLDEAIVWEVDAATMQFSFVSSRGETVTGFPRAEWKGSPEFWSAHMPTEDWATLQEAFRRSSQALDERCEHRFIRRDRAVRRMRTIIHFRKSGQSARFQGVSLDVTSQRDADARETH